MMKALNGAIKCRLYSGYRVGTDAMHLTVKLAKERRVIDPRGWNPKSERYYVTAAFVRNPWDRLVSEFHWRSPWTRVEAMLAWDDFCAVKDRTFDQFVHALWNVWDSLAMYRHDKICHVLPQHLWTHEDGKQAVTVVGRYEKLQADWDVVGCTAGLPRTKLPHVNKSKHKPYWMYYTDETKKLVEQMYGEDIDLFKYQFTV